MKQGCIIYTITRYPCCSVEAAKTLYPCMIFCEWSRLQKSREITEKLESPQTNSYQSKQVPEYDHRRSDLMTGSVALVIHDLLGLLTIYNIVVFWGAPLVSRSECSTAEHGFQVLHACQDSKNLIKSTRYDASLTDNGLLQSSKG